MRPKIEEVIKTSSIIIHSGRYIYLKTKDKNLGPHFFISQDKDEVTIVTEEKNLNTVNYLGIVKWFKLIEIKLSVPFFQGFLSRVIKPIADAGYNTLIISTFSKDYILTREENINQVAKILVDTGFKVIFENEHLKKSLMA